MTKCNFLVSLCVRERVCVFMCVRESVREKERVCVCACEREKERVCVFMCVRVSVRQKECVGVWVCVCMRKKREWVSREEEKGVVRTHLAESLMSQTLM